MTSIKEHLTPNVLAVLAALGFSADDVVFADQLSSTHGRIKVGHLRRDNTVKESDPPSVYSGGCWDIHHRFGEETETMPIKVFPPSREIWGVESSFWAKYTYYSHPTPISEKQHIAHRFFSSQSVALRWASRARRLNVYIDNAKLMSDTQLHEVICWIKTLAVVPQNIGHGGSFQITSLPTRWFRLLPHWGEIQIGKENFDKWNKSVGARVPLPTTRAGFLKSLDTLVEMSSQSATKN